MTGLSQVLRVTTCAVVLVSIATAASAQENFARDRAPSVSEAERAPMVETAADFQAAASCPGTPTSSCTVSFPTVGQKKRLVITNASCFISTTAATTEIDGIGLGVSGGNLFAFLDPVANKTAANPSYSANTTTSITFKTGTTPSILAFTSGGNISSMLCSVFGTMYTRGKK